jgi:diphthine-ammonia ligase
MTKAFVSWSGGKDCCLAAYKAIKQGIELRCLLNMTTNEGGRSCSHGMAARWIRLQSEALEIPVLQYPANKDNYAEVFTNALLELAKQGVTVGVFGDIDFNPHREWIERICGPSGINPLLPMWLDDQNNIVNEFINLGFQAKVVATRADILGKEWLGRDVNRSFFDDIANLNKDITPCGEAGEFNTLVIDGPIFKKRLDIRDAEIEKRDKHWFWDIKNIELVQKQQGEYR